MISFALTFKNNIDLSKIDDFSDITAKKLPVTIKHFIFAAFRDEGRPESKWKPAAQNSKRRRRDYGIRSKILTDTGKLRNSFRYQSGRNSVIISSDIHYAAAHQYGAVISIPQRSQWLRLGRIGGKTFFLRYKNSRMFDSIALGRNRKTGHAHRSVGLKYQTSGYWKKCTIPAHRIILPARPFLPVPMADKEKASVCRLIKEHIVNVLKG